MRAWSMGLTLRKLQSMCSVAIVGALSPQIHSTIIDIDLMTIEDQSFLDSASLSILALIFNFVSGNVRFEMRHRL